MTREQTLRLRLAEHYHQELRTWEKQYDEGGEAALTALNSFDKNRGQIEHTHQWLTSDNSVEGVYLRINYGLAASNIMKIRLLPTDYLRWLEHALHAVRGFSEPSYDAEAKLLSLYGDLQIHLGQYSAAQETLDAGLEFVRLHGLQIREEEFIYQLERLALLQGRLSFVLKMDDQATMQTNSELALFSRAQALTMRRRFKDAIVLLEPLLASARKAHNLANTAGAAHALGNIYVELKDYDRASAYAAETIALGKTLNDRQTISHGTLLLGTCCVFQLQYDNALAHFKQVLEIDTQLHDLRGVANATQNIGSVYYMRKEYKEAITYFEQARVIFVELNAEHAVKTVDRMISHCRTMMHPVMKIMALSPLVPVTDYVFGPLFSRIRQSWSHWREQQSYK
jgi:tetratricopeptide (TPR) repeat protein